MGAECFATTPNQHYNRFLEKVKVSELKDHWTTVKLYKIKKIYNKAASPHPEYKKHTHVNFESFKQLFPEFERYEQMQKRRIFQFFDYDNLGYIDWNNFYSSISICYFATQQILKVIMFMIFDAHLMKSLDKQQLMLLCDLNSFCITQNHEANCVTPCYQPEQIVEQLLKERQSVSIEQWNDKASIYFDFSKYRRLFNIFLEEKLEKQLVANFNTWNNLFNQQEERYISYLISFKWFQSWKVYVFQQYGIIINSNALNAPTLKTIKTKKTVKSEVKSAKKIQAMKYWRQIKVDYGKKKQKQVPQSLKNYDLVHSNIGQRPRQIYNNVLEGQFEEVLKGQLIENRDYILISQKVWECLKAIYEGFPQFRRTGYDFIQLYPKVLKIYSSMFGEQLDYSSEIMRQVSSYLTLSQLFLKSIGLSQQQLDSKSIFFKTIGMVKWQQATDLTYMFTELTPEVIIFLTYIDKATAQSFKKNHCRISKQITEINIGDSIVFQESNSGVQKHAIYMGKNTQGKYILHYPGQSYIYDNCVMQEQVYKKSKLVLKQAIEEVKLKKKSQLHLIGLNNLKGIGFINSVIIHLLDNKDLKNMLAFIKVDKDGPTSVIQVISQISSLLSNRTKVDPRDILDMIEIMLSQYQNFQFSMCYGFLHDFFDKISRQLKKQSIKDIISEQYMFKMNKKIKCDNCKKITDMQIENTFLSLSIPEHQQSFFQIIYVPYSQSLKATEIKRYGFKISRNSTLKQYKQTFEKLAEINSKYILVQIYSNNIIKNFQSANDNLTLNQLYLRDNDVIYAFELYVNFDKFITEHYSINKDITNKQFKADMFVDCRHDERGWIFGKISEIQFLPYTHRTIFRVIHKFSKNQQWQISYDLYDGAIANFPTKSYLNGQQYHIRLLQRYFNQPSNQMQLCNTPLVIVLTNWMRWKQFYYYIYLQISRFIDDLYIFKDQEEAKILPVGTMKQIQQNKQLKKKNKVMATNKIKLNKFKDYLYGPQFPYKINFADRDNRCAICFKFLKLQVRKGQNNTYCSGCELSNSEPISWQLKVSDIVVCVDWKDLKKMKKNMIKDHSSYVNLLQSKKNDVETLQNCLQKKLETYKQTQDTICCNRESQCEIIQKILNVPANFILFLERVIEEDGFKKTINKYVSFEFELQINQEQYILVGVTSIQGTNKNVKYKTYLNNNDQWYEYDGELVKTVKKNIIQKVCAQVLYYKKKSKLKKPLLNPDSKDQNSIKEQQFI